MIHLLRVVDRALGYAFIADASTTTSELSPAAHSDSHAESRSKHDNRHALFTSAAGLFPHGPKVQDIQERWVDEKERYDDWQLAQWQKEGVSAALGQETKNRQST